MKRCSPDFSLRVSVLPLSLPSLPSLSQVSKSGHGKEKKRKKGPFLSLSSIRTTRSRLVLELQKIIFVSSPI